MSTIVPGQTVSGGGTVYDLGPAPISSLTFTRLAGNQATMVTDTGSAGFLPNTSDGFPITGFDEIDSPSVGYLLNLEVVLDIAPWHTHNGIIYNLTLLGTHGTSGAQAKTLLPGASPQTKVVTDVADNETATVTFTYDTSETAGAAMTIAVSITGTSSASSSIQIFAGSFSQLAPVSTPADWSQTTGQLIYAPASIPGLQLFITFSAWT